MSWSVFLKETVWWKLLFTSILPFATSWEIHLFLPTSYIKIQPFIFSIFDLLSMSYHQFIFHFSILGKLWGMNNVPVVRKNPSYASRTANYTFWDWKSVKIFCQSVREFLHYINTILINEMHTHLSLAMERWKKFLAYGLE